VPTPSTELPTKENDKQPATTVVVGEKSPTKVHKETGVSDLSEVMTQLHHARHPLPDNQQVIENMRKSPSLIPNGGSLEGDSPNILPQIEEPPVDKAVIKADLEVSVAPPHNGL